MFTNADIIKQTKTLANIKSICLMVAGIEMVVDNSKDPSIFDPVVTHLEKAVKAVDELYEKELVKVREALNARV